MFSKMGVVQGGWRNVGVSGNIASVLVGLSLRELDVIHWCMELMQEESRLGA